MAMFGGFVRLLSGDEPKRELGGGMRRDHRLRVGSAIAAVVAVDFCCRPRSEPLGDAAVRVLYFGPPAVTIDSRVCCSSSRGRDRPTPPRRESLRYRSQGYAKWQS